MLAYTSPARGHLYPVVPIMAALAERGHRAYVYSLSDELGELARLGIEGTAIDPAVERNQLEDWRERTPPQAVRSMLRTFAERSGRDAADLARAIAHCDPDVLLIDISCWGAATAAEASGRAWAMYAPHLLLLPSREVPPIGPDWLPWGDRSAQCAMRSCGPWCTASSTGGRCRRSTRCAPSTAWGHSIATATCSRVPRCCWRSPRRASSTRAALGRRMCAWSVPSAGPRRSRRHYGSPRCRTRWCSSPARPSASATGASSASPWRGCRQGGCPCSPPQPPTTPTRSSPRRVAVWCASSPTRQSWTARRAWSATAAWGSPRRRSRPGFRSWWCPSGATSSRPRVGLSSPRRGSDCRLAASPRSGSCARSRPRSTGARARRA